jgi:hypothetical protein
MRIPTAIAPVLAVPPRLMAVVTLGTVHRLQSPIPKTSAGVIYLASWYRLGQVIARTLASASSFLARPGESIGTK